MSEYELVRTGVVVDDVTGEVGGIEGKNRRYQLSDQRLVDIHKLSKALADALADHIETLWDDAVAEVEGLPPEDRIALPELTVEPETPIDPEAVRIGLGAFLRQILRAGREEE